jgi:hypothetical protein
MRVTIHAAQRFVERVLKLHSFSSKEIARAKTYLEMLTKDIVPNSYAKRFVLPGFESYFCVCYENAIVTVIPKDKKIMKPHSKKYQYSPLEECAA